MWAKGIVIGKFYPPHAGHKFLIDTAQSQVEHLTILICRGKDQDPPVELRAKWLREIHPKAEVRIIEDEAADDDSEGWARNTIAFLGYVPDVVFTSEDYGDPYAHFMGCKHVLVDKMRLHVPCAGHIIRQNPLSYWEFLEPPVRAHYARRIAIVGAESTGTTTLARDLAQAYHTSWVPEYGRMYSEGKLPANGGSDWRTEEFKHIAQMQNLLEDQLACTANELLFCDTNAFATAIWHERYMGTWSEEVEWVSADRKYDFYIVTDDSIPFVQDGTRDGEKIRHWMHERFIAELEKRNIPYLLVKGTLEERVNQVKEALA